MSSGRWMDKEDVVCIYNVTALSRKKEWIWVSSSELAAAAAAASEVDEPH